MSSRLLALLVGASALFGSAAGSLAEPARDLIIVAGQSNAFGPRSDPTETDVQLSHPRVRFWWSEPGLNMPKRWGDLAPQPGSTPHGHFGPEIGIADRWSEDLAIFKFTKGATSLARDWQPGDPHGLLQAMLVELRDAADHATSTLHPVCLVWVQGESDAETDEMAGTYERRLKQTIDLVREAVGNPELPVVLSVDEQHSWVAARLQIVEDQQAIAASMPHVAWSSMRGLPKADQTHLTAAGSLEQGHRLGDACKMLQPAR